MARDHETTSNEKSGGGTHHTKHSYEDSNSRRSYDRAESGEKQNDHSTDQSSGRTYYSQDSGKNKTDDVTDSKGNKESRPGIDDFNEKHDNK